MSLGQIVWWCADCKHTYTSPPRTEDGRRFHNQWTCGTPMYRVRLVHLPLKGVAS